MENELEVAATLEGWGFTIITLSSLSYSDQVSIFRRASHVVGMHGAGLTNLVFCPSGTHVLEILHPPGGSGAYSVMGTALDIQYSALMGSDLEIDNETLHALTFKAESELGMAGRSTTLNRDVVVDLDELRRWAKDIGLVEI